MNLNKGTGYLILGWALVLGSGYVYILWLTHYWEPETYGLYTLTMSVLYWIEIAVVNGVPYALQKFLPQESGRSSGLFRYAAGLQTVVVSGLFLLTFFTAPLIAAALRDYRLAFYLRIASIDILFFGFYHLLMAYQNGRRHFGRQAVLLVVYAVSKTGFGIALVALTHSIVGALIGNIAGSITAFIAGLCLFSRMPAAPWEQSRTFIRFMFPASAYFWILNLFFFLDLWFVKYYCDLETAACYSIAQMISKIPFFLFSGLSSVLLPILSFHFSSAALQDARRTISQAVRLLWLLTLPVAVLFTMLNRPILELLFRPEYSSAAPIFALLTWSIVFLSFLSLFTTVLNAFHKPGLSLGWTAGALILSIALNRIWVPQFGARGAAYAMLVSTGFGAGALSIILFDRFQSLMPVFSFLRISLAGLALMPLAGFLKPRGVMLPVFVLFAFILYGALLLVLKEMNWPEIREICGLGAASKRKFPEQTRSGT
ncbi:oligosaccharide flippase family protein [bacterium]|nr:oligosaccharide flippase family protein [bacterium]